MEERLKFLATGDKPRKNKDVMNEVIQQLKAEGLYHETAEKPKKTEVGKKRKLSDIGVDPEAKDERPKKKKKKDKA